jgi:hypothetical protein
MDAFLVFNADLAEVLLKTFTLPEPEPTTAIQDDIDFEDPESVTMEQYYHKSQRFITM